MTEPELIALDLDDTFTFACHSDVPCFNQCCQDLNQALTPYDVLRLKKNLTISSQTFLERYADIRVGPATGLPVVSLRFASDKDGHCPFVTQQGCSVYDDRPASCRIYPLMRMLRRSRSDGSLTEQYALLKEPHCRGFEQTHTQTVRQWITSQALAEYHELNDALLELIAMKNQLRPGPLSQPHLEMVQMAFYDLERLKERAENGQLEGLDAADLTPVTELDDEVDWLRWSMGWVKVVLFGGMVAADRGV